MFFFSSRWIIINTCNFIFINSNKEKISSRIDIVKARIKVKNLYIIRTKSFFLNPKYIEATLAKRLKKMNWIAAKKETTEIKKFVSICDMKVKSNFVKYLIEINININEITSDGIWLPTNKIN